MSSRTPEIESGSGAVVVTPNDTTEFRPTRGVYIGVSGDLKATFIDGSSATLTNLAAGVVHPLRVKLINATGTTATGIVAVY